MELSNEELIELKKFYEFVGVNKSAVTKGTELVDVFRLLKIKPELDENGFRKFTPYEILGVPPQFRDGKHESPIVFAIKNRAKKIGKPSCEYGTFIYQSKKVKEEDSLLEQIIEDYKHAVFCGDAAEAEKFKDLIDALTQGKADEIIGSFYDYHKFYRKMKKQLLIDIFSHFFLMYIQARNLSIKKGIIKGNKVYRAYREDERYAEREELLPNFGVNMGPDMPVIQSISVGGTEDYEKKIQTKDSHEQKNTAPVQSEVAAVMSSIEEKISEEKDNIKNMIRGFDNIRNKSEDYIEQMLNDNPLNPPETMEPAFFENEILENADMVEEFRKESMKMIDIEELRKHPLNESDFEELKKTLNEMDLSSFNEINMNDMEEIKNNNFEQNIQQNFEKQKPNKDHLFEREGRSYE